MLLIEFMQFLLVMDMSIGLDVSIGLGVSIGLDDSLGNCQGNMIWKEMDSYARCIVPNASPLSSFCERMQLAKRQATLASGSFSCCDDNGLRKIPRLFRMPRLDGSSHVVHVEMICDAIGNEYYCSVNSRINWKGIECRLGNQSLAGLV